jgi:hypothetical protein
VDVHITANVTAMTKKNEQQNQLSEKQLNYKVALEKARALVEMLETDCPHHFRKLTEEELGDQWMSVSACCEICGKYFGWRCKKSPTQYCIYNEIDDPFQDSCIHCGYPDERK